MKVVQESGAPNTMFVYPVVLNKKSLQNFLNSLNNFALLHNNYVTAQNVYEFKNVANTTSVMT